MIADRLSHADAWSRVAPSLLVLAALWAAGCGMPGAPQPPSLHLPERVLDLAVSRTGNTVRLTWTMPRRTTDRILLTGDLSVHICRQVESSVCDPAADIEQRAATPARYEDHLPAADVVGAPRLLTYTVEVRNKTGHGAGLSNPAYTAAGAAPPAVAGLTAQVGPEGVLLRWEASSARDGAGIRLHRVLLGAAAGTASRSKGTPLGAAPDVMAEQTLMIDPSPRAALLMALDKDAALNHSYVYTALRVSALTIGGHTFEWQGASSEPLTVDARDVFPPRAPAGLVAVSGGGEAAIDLSWNENAESDLAGYVVYRQEMGASGPWQRVSPPASLVIAPAFRDATIIAGHSYAYQVTAVDLNGNESARSSAAQETAPKSQ